MSGINKVTLIGHLGDDPVCSTMQNGQTIARIRLATTERWKDRQTGERREATEWHRVVFFSGLADTVRQYLKRGAKIYIEGKLRTRKWQDDSGQDRYTTEVVVSGPNAQMVMLDRPSGKSGGGYDGQQDGYDAPPFDDEPQSAAPRPQQQQRPATPSQGGASEPEFDDQLDDIPF